MPVFVEKHDQRQKYNRQGYLAIAGNSGIFLTPTFVSMSAGI